MDGGIRGLAGREGGFEFGYRGGSVIPLEMNETERAMGSCAKRRDSRDPILRSNSDRRFDRKQQF